MVSMFYIVLCYWCSGLSTFVYAVHSTVNIIDLNGIEEALCKVLLACRCAYMISTVQSGCLSGVVCVVSLLGPVLLAVLIVRIHSWQSALRSIKRSAFESWFLNIRKPRLHRSRLQPFLFRLFSLAACFPSPFSLCLSSSVLSFCVGQGPQGAHLCTVAPLVI